MNQGIPAVIFAGILWGTINIFVKKLSTEGLNPMQIVLLRMCVASAVLSAVTLIRDPRRLKIKLRDLWLFAGTGIISVVFFNYFYFYTIVNGEASVAVVLLYTSPVFIVVASAVLFKEQITWNKAIACALTLVGCALTSGLLGNHLIISGKVFVTGIASGFLYAMYTVFGRLALNKYNAVTVTLYSFFFGLLGSLFITEKGGIVEILLADPINLLYVLGLGTLCTVLPYYLYTYGLQKIEAGKAGVCVAVEPAVGAVLGMTLYGEDRSLLKILGILLVLNAIIIMNTNLRRRGK